MFISVSYEKNGQFSLFAFEQFVYFTHMKILILLFMLLSSALAATIFEFKPSETTWYLRNDSVMGGISKSQIALRNGLLEFTGRVRLENGGGFSGIRSAAGQYDLSKFSSLVLRVRGDGKRYGLQLGMNSSSRITYRMQFNTVAGKWIEVRLPFQSFRAMRSGEFIQAAPLDPSRIAFFGLTFGNGRAERFKLELDWVKGQ
jgi:NADH dehydrogenase [ubiquinone] 1 alpha subcomplex assembly factor 1